MKTQTRVNLLVSTIVLLAVLSAVGALSVSAKTTNKFNKSKADNHSALSKGIPDSVKAEVKAMHESGDKEGMKATLQANGMSPPAFGKRENPGMSWMKNVPEDLRVQLKALMEYGDRDAIDAFIEENGIDAPDQPKVRPKHRKFQNLLPDDIREELKAFHDSGDREGAQEFLEENGFKIPVRARGQLEVAHN